jgi:hypothetical protein
MIEESTHCISCKQPTDTFLAIDAPPFWHIEFLVRLGDSEEEAIEFIGDSAETRSLYAVCPSCAHRAGYPEPVAVNEGVPLLGPPSPVN